MMASFPRITVAREAVSYTSPAFAVRPSRSSSFSGSGTIAVTTCPRSSASLSNAEPTKPVAPSRATFISSSSPSVAAALGHADAWHCDLLKQVRDGDHGGRIRGEAGPELWMREGGAVMGRRLPNCVVHVGRTVPDGAVKLSRDEPRLPFHEGRVVLPCLEETWLIGF